MIYMSLSEYKKIKSNNKKRAFNLADTLLALVVIGIVASLCVPVAVTAHLDRQNMSSLVKFNSLLENAISQWKIDILCKDDAYTCLSQQNLSPNNCANFDQISKYMKIGPKLNINEDARSVVWLPEQTYEYNGDNQAGNLGGVSKMSSGMCRYVLLDGTAFAVLVSPSGFDIHVDVNGISPPNRMGKDTFPITIGNFRGKDIYYYPSDSTQETNTEGLCALSASNCNPDNYNPTVDNGASITTYVLSHQKFPDFKELSKQISGFKP